MTFYAISAPYFNDNQNIMASMHTVRCEVFYKIMGWREGLIIKDQNKEYDEYDHNNCEYIVDVDADHNILSSCRLLPTTLPYMIKDHYNNFVAHGKLPNSYDIHEISRFCSNPNIAPEKGKAPPAALLTAALIEHGLGNNIKSYIALTNIDVFKMIRRIGWNPKPLGDEINTPEGKPSVVCSYTVSEKILADIKKRHGIKQDLLHDIADPKKLIMETFRESKSEKEKSTVPKRNLLDIPKLPNLFPTTFPNPISFGGIQP